jgi:hypothetical protein
LYPQSDESYDVIPYQFGTHTHTHTYNSHSSTKEESKKSTLLLGEVFHKVLSREATEEDDDEDATVDVSVPKSSSSGVK